MDLTRFAIVAILGLHFFTYAKKLVRGKLDMQDKKIVCSVVKGSQNFRSNHTVECRKCSQCPAGHGLKEKCHANSDTICEKCSDGFFSPGGTRHCKKCKSCPKTSHQIRSCTNTHNTRCKFCKIGRYFSNEHKKCLKCLKCPPGFFVKEVCSATSGTICRQCPSGTYTDRHNMDTKCSPCTPCHYNEDIITACTRKHDNMCGNCSRGFFRLLATRECAKCSNCYRDFPGYTFEIDECSSQTKDNSTICMPVLYPPFKYNNNFTNFSIDAVMKHSPKTTNTDIFVIGSILSIVLIMVIAIVILSQMHCKHVNNMMKTNHTNRTDYISETPTATWVKQLPLVSMRSNSAPFIFHSNALFSEYSEQFHAKSDLNISGKYLKRISDENLNVMYEKMHQLYQSR